MSHVSGGPTPLSFLCVCSFVFFHGRVGFCVHLFTRLLLPSGIMTSSLNRAYQLIFPVSLLPLSLRNPFQFPLKKTGAQFPVTSI